MIPSAAFFLFRIASVVLVLLCLHSSIWFCSIEILLEVLLILHESDDCPVRMTIFTTLVLLI